MIRARSICASLSALLSVGLSWNGAAAERASFTRSFTLDSGAFTHVGVPNVVVHGRRPRDPQAPLSVVVFLHGFRGCALAQMASDAVTCGRTPTVAGGHLARVHERAETDTLLVVPQLALLKRDGSPGRFGRRDGFRAFLIELLDQALAEQLGPGAFGRVTRIALVAHSAGYQTALAILDRGGVDRVHDVVLLDALYAGAGRFERWLAADPAHRLLSLHAGRGKPARFSRALSRRLARAGLPSLRLDHAMLDSSRAPTASPPPVAPFRWAVAEVDTPHGHFPRAHLAPILKLLFVR